MNLPEKLLDRERNIEPEVPTSTKAKAIYEDDIWEKTTTLMMRSPGLKKSGFIDIEIQQYEDHLALVYKRMQEVNIAEFIKRSDDNVKLWKNSAVIKRQLHLPRRDLRRPDIEYPQRFFDIVYNAENVGVKEESKVQVSLSTIRVGMLY